MSTCQAPSRAWLCLRYMHLLISCLRSQLSYAWYLISHLTACRISRLCRCSMPAATSSRHSSPARKSPRNLPEQIASWKLPWSQYSRISQVSRKSAPSRAASFICAAALPCGLQGLEDRVLGLWGLGFCCLCIGLPHGHAGANTL